MRPISVRAEVSKPIASVEPLHELTAEADDAAPPPALLPYQQAWVADQAQLKIAEKSRRIGLTWAEAADDVLIASQAGGSNVFYISATQDMAREYIEACAMWAQAFNVLAGQIGEGLFEDTDDAGTTKHIKMFEVTFPQTKRRIVALSSRPTNLRGKQGVVVIDEAAFAPDLAQLLKAAMAMLLWGDKVRIISTHNGVENPFAQLIEEVRAGKRGADASVHRITFQEAVNDGLYQRVCLRKGKPWSQSAQDAWVKQAYAFYGDDAAEELDVIPNASTGAYLPLSLITSRMSPHTPLVRGKWDAAFGDLSADTRRLAVEGWLNESITPHLKNLSPLCKHGFGQDFGRVRDLTVITVLARGSDLVERTALVVELSNCPFAQQQQILWHIIRALPRFAGGAMDATGNGAMLAELTAQQFGTGLIEQVKLSETFYREHMPKLKAALQDGTLVDLPRDEQIRDDLRAIRVIDGTPKLPKAPTQKADDGPKLQRHGDAAIAFFLAIYNASRAVGEIGWMSAGSAAQGDGDDDDWADDDHAAWHAKRRS